MTRTPCSLTTAAAKTPDRSGPDGGRGARPPCGTAPGGLAFRRVALGVRVRGGLISRGRANDMRSLIASISSTLSKPRSASQVSTPSTSSSGTDAPLDTPTVLTPSSQRSSISVASSTR